MAGASKQIFVLVLSAYHRLLSPLLPCACRFLPSCSMYAAEAIQRYGIFKGTYLCLRRLGRCHPWNPGGYDPIH